MKRNSTIYLCMSVGSLVGGFVPSLWDASIFSVSGVLLAGVGGFLGIWIGYKISHLD